MCLRWAGVLMCSFQFRFEIRIPAALRQSHVVCARIASAKSVRALNRICCCWLFIYDSEVRRKCLVLSFTFDVLLRVRSTEHIATRLAMLMPNRFSHRWTPNVYIPRVVEAFGSAAADGEDTSGGLRLACVGSRSKRIRKWYIDQNAWHEFKFQLLWGALIWVAIARYIPN